MAFSLALNMQTLAIACGLAAVIAAGSAWYIQSLRIDNLELTYKAEKAEMQAKVNKAEGDANKLRLDFQTKLGEKKDELDKDYATRVAGINTTVSKLAGIRLRDPSAGRDSGSTGNQGNAQGNLGPATGELSLETSNFLWSLAGDADVVRERLRVCQAWNATLTAESQKYYDEIQTLKKSLK